MPAATITSKGQITLPKPIRDSLGVGPGDRVAFRELADGTIRVEADTVDLMSLRGSVKTKVRGVTVEMMERAIAQGAAGRDSTQRARRSSGR